MTAVPTWLAGVLPGHTAEAWEALAGILPGHAYLGGGTAVAVHLQHRVSRDLDVFFESPPDIDGLESALAACGPMRTMRKAGGTLECIFRDARVQLLDASDHHLVEPAEAVAGLRVAGLGDLMGMKLRAITDRGEHRDYLDLATIENDGHRLVEEGLGYFVARYGPANPDDAVASVVRSLGYLGDVEDDPALALSIGELERYWARRVRGIAGRLGRSGYDHLAGAEGPVDRARALAMVRAVGRAGRAGPIGPHRPLDGTCRARTAKRRRCPLDALPGSTRCGVHGDVSA